MRDADGKPPSIRPSEIFFVAFCVMVFGVSSLLYFNDFSIWRTLNGRDLEAVSLAVGKVSAMTGKPKRRLVRDLDFQELTLGAAVLSQDTLITMDGAELTVEFQNGSQLELGTESLVRLEVVSELGLSGVQRTIQAEVLQGSMRGRAGGSDSKLYIKAVNQPVITLKNRATELLELKNTPH